MTETAEHIHHLPTPLPVPRWVRVTPDLAAQMLERNQGNRTLKSARFSYAADMKSGDWRESAADPIRFAHDGRLLDGQNRLWAVIDAGVPVNMLVVEGLDPDVQLVMDSGVNRKFTDVLKLRGELNVPALGSIVRLSYQWEQGPTVMFKGRVSNSALLHYLEANPGLRDVASKSQTWQSHVAAPGSILGACYWRFSKIDVDDADYFMKRLCSEVGHHENDPIFRLRSTLQKSSEAVRAQRNRQWLTAIIVKAWNDYRAGSERLTGYRWSPGGAKPESFPEAV